MTAAAHPYGTSSYASAELPYQQPPPRMGWSLYVLAAGCLAMFVSLLLVVAGVPAQMFYDADAKGERNRNTSWDPLKMSQSIDANMKYVRENTGYKPNQYNGYLTAIYDSEAAVPTMAQSVADMTASVEQIDTGLAGVLNTTVHMRRDMEAMAEISGSSASTMQSLGSDINQLNGAMNQMYNATLQLTAAMGSLEKQATVIADTRTGKALKTTRSLNQALPTGVPKPTTSLMPVHAEGAV